MIDCSAPKTAAAAAAAAGAVKRAQRPEARAPLDERPQNWPLLNFSARPSETPRMTPTASLPRNDRRLVFTSSQAARYLGVSLATIRRWTDAGHISCYRTPGGQRRFAREQLDVFVSSMYRNGNGSGEEYGSDSSHAVHGLRTGAHAA
jgi:excisionase family DNA binding protein